MVWNDPPPDAEAFGLRGVSIRRAGRNILDDVTLAIRSGEIHALAGSKNSGKSAICAVLAGYLRPDSGCVRIGGEEYAAIGVGQARDLGVFSVSSVPKVFPDLSVGENFLSGESFWVRTFRAWRDYLGDIRRWLDEYGVDLDLSAPLEAMPKEDWIFIEALSRLYRSPSLLIMDEVLESLNPQRRRLLMPILGKHVENGMSILWVTHKVEEALIVVDRISVVRNGNLLLTTPPGGLDQLSLIQLCYAQIEELEDIDTTSRQFRQLMRFTAAVIRDLPQAVAILDGDLRIGFVNRKAAGLFVGEANSWLGKGLEDLLGIENAPLAATILAAVDRDVREWHNLPVRYAGGEMLADVSLRAIFENSDRIGQMLIIEDVSAREELRRQAMLANNLSSVGLLAAGVAHEVNNPLEVMGNYLSYLRQRTEDPDLRRVLAKVEEESTRIQQIVRNLIVFSGSTADSSAMVDLPALCLELCELLRFHNRDRRVVFACEEPEEGILVRGDSNELRQVLLNLFRNSIDALPGGGRVEIRFARAASDKGMMVVMRFSDNGPGISLPNPSDIFLPFVSTRKGANKNHGLGLSIVYGIIEKYGGAIKVENIREGGCRFTISLPLAGMAPVDENA